MAEVSQEPAASPDDEEALRKRLINRIALAGVLVVALLGSLAVFDALYVPPVPQKPVATAPAQPVAAPKTEEPPAVEPPPEPPKVAAAEPEPPAVPEETSAAKGRPLKPLTPPATARPAMVKPSAPLAPVKPDAARDIAKAHPASPGPLSKPLSQAVGSARQYVLQVGVFNNVANAEELRAKLELAGIPSQIEARVQVGPFKTREEAEAAREKLRALGMDGGILTALRK